MPKVIKQKPELQWVQVSGRATISLGFDRAELLRSFPEKKVDSMSDRELIKLAIAHGSFTVFPDKDGWMVETEVKQPAKLVDLT
jgi:hypothetical protein